jgi:hypothetical protein
MSKHDEKSLSPEDMVSERQIGRRSALGILGIGVVGAAAVAAVTGAPSRAAAKTSDSDQGPNADAGGHGHTGRSDSDSGPNADRAGHGRTRCSDTDSGSQADPAGSGQHC